MSLLRVILTDPWGAERAGFSARGKIDRTDFGALPGTRHSKLVGSSSAMKCKISVEVELIRQAKQGRGLSPPMCRAPT